MCCNMKLMNTEFQGKVVNELKGYKTTSLW